ncbi:MAG TPA: mechanosensitive ion channel domain-containing protein [Gammaproteobacteria bacterium]|nr:mechanosensitive ion channel domain-containing protein [Gammaproteobacteria bacterium]
MNLPTQKIINFYHANSEYLYPFSKYLTALLIVFALSVGIQIFLSKNKKNLYHTAHFLVEVCKIPVIVFLSLYVLYLLLFSVHQYYPQEIKYKILRTIDYAIEFITLFWCLQNSLSSGKKRLTTWLLKTQHTISYILLKMISDSLQAIVYIILLNIFIPQMGLTGLSGEYTQKIMHLILIGTIGWVFIQILNGTEQLIINKTTHSENNLHGNRKITTQVKILKRVLLVVSLIVIIAAMLMVFDSVRSIGAGLLTTAGIIGAAGAFASQRSLAGLFSGLNLAFTQPIRIGDTVVIDKDSGQVEEITLSYVVIKLWDLRRLILPTDHFTNKGVVNLTRNSTELVGAILIYVDYKLQVDVLRKKFYEILEESTLWDKKTSAFQVSDLKEQSVEIRALVSARNSGDLWNLRCEIREKLLSFIVENFPQNLPKAWPLLMNPA